MRETGATMIFDNGVNPESRARPRAPVASCARRRMEIERFPARIYRNRYYRLMVSACTTVISNNIQHLRLMPVSRVSPEALVTSEGSKSSMDGCGETESGQSARPSDLNRGSSADATHLLCGIVAFKFIFQVFGHTRTHSRTTMNKNVLALEPHAPK